MKSLPLFSVGAGSATVATCCTIVDLHSLALLLSLHATGEVSASDRLLPLVEESVEAVQAEGQAMTASAAAIATYITDMVSVPHACMCQAPGGRVLIGQAPPRTRRIGR